MAPPAAKRRQQSRGGEPASLAACRPCGPGQRDHSSFCRDNKDHQTKPAFTSGIASNPPPEIPELSLHPKYKQVQIWGEQRQSIKPKWKTFTFLGPTTSSPFPTATTLQSVKNNRRPRRSTPRGQRQRQQREAPWKGMLRQEDAAGSATVDSMRLLPRIRRSHTQLGRSPPGPSIGKRWRVSLGEGLLLPQRFPCSLPGSLAQTQWKGDQWGCPTARGCRGHPGQCRCSRTSWRGRRGSEAGGDGGSASQHPAGFDTSMGP